MINTQVHQEELEVMRKRGILLIQVLPVLSLRIRTGEGVNLVAKATYVGVVLLLISAKERGEMSSRLRVWSDENTNAKLEDMNDGSLSDKTRQYSDQNKLSLI